MTWDELQKKAKTKGQLVFAMKQSETPVMTQPGPWGTSTDGYCIGLAATWISLNYASRNFPFDAGPVCDDPPWKSTMSQTLSDATLSVSGKWLDFWKAAIEPFQMTLSDGLRATRKSTPTGTFIHSIVTQAYGCYGVTLERGAGAHAIALRHAKDNRMHLFDANEGHFVVRDHTLLKSFLDWYLKTTGYDARYTVATRIVGIRPPIG